MRTGGPLLALWFGLAGCGIVAGGGPTLDLLFGGPAVHDLEMVVVVDGRIHRLAHGERREVDVDDDDHQVVVEVLRSDGGSVGLVQFDARYRNGSDYWIHVLVGLRPEGHCVGQVTPLGVVAADSLYVIHGGLPRDAIC